MNQQTREEALKQAVIARNHEDKPEDIVARAEAFQAFLSERQ